MLLTVADLILRLAKLEEISITPLQLMKLVYILNGWSMAARNEPLFYEKIEAWKYGPVMPDLYQATKKCGRNEIPLSIIGEGTVELEKALSKDTIDFVKSVFDAYKNKTGIELSNLTHKSGTPWDATYAPNVRNNEIPLELIKSH